MERVFIIAEAGVNHNGHMNIAKSMIEIAAHAGADCIKFQTFKPEELVSKYAKKAGYQKENLIDTDDSQLNMLKRYELSVDDHLLLMEHCKKHGIEFLSTPFDLQSITLLDQLNISKWKIPSGEITNYPYLNTISKSTKPILLSTGMSTMEEIDDALQILRQYGNNDITLLHCNTQYPTPFESVNLMAMQTMKERFGLCVGYSDHTEGIEIPIAAVALGASVIEKHFTLDKAMEGPDHCASLNPEELLAMVTAIRHIEKAVGDGIKKPSASEMPNIEVVRKSIVASCRIEKGEVFTEKNITVKRPATGISPMKWNAVLGQSALRNFEEDECIEV